MIKAGPYEVYPLEASCWRIEESSVRAFLVAGAQKALLIDSGYGTGNIREVAESLTNLPLTLVNTHADRDHIGCNALFPEARMHPAEYDRYHRGNGAGLTAKPIWEGERIDLGGRVLEVLLIPGHTPGSIALLDREHRVLFGGDSVQAGVIYMFGPGRDIDAYIDSLTRLAALRNSFDTVYPSHGPIPVGADILPGLTDGARRVRAGEIPGTAAPPHVTAARVYDAGVAKFLYD